MRNIKTLREALDRRSRTDPGSKYLTERRSGWRLPTEMAREALDDADTALAAGDVVRRRRFLAMAEAGVRAGRGLLRSRNKAVLST